MKRGIIKFLGGALTIMAFITASNCRACGGGAGTFTNIPTLGGDVFQVNGLNAAGQVTGYSYLPGNTAEHAFLYEAGATADLGTLGANISIGYALNASGQVVGDANLPDYETHAALFTGGGVVDLGTLGGDFASARAINDAGQIVGSSQTAGDLAQEAFLYTGGTMTNLGDLGGHGSSAIAINQRGDIAGDSYTPDFDQHAFIYTNGAMGDLGTLGGNYSSAFALNDNGAVIGESSLANGDIHAFIYTGGVLTDLGTLGGTLSSAVAVNNLDQVIAFSFTTNNAQFGGFIYRNGVVTDLGTLGGDYCSPSAINNLGQVVGDSAIPSGDSHAFIWQNGTIADLNSNLPANSGWELFTALFINDSGRIVGTGALNGAPQWYALDLGTASSPPLAVAGPDQTAQCHSPVTLDGTHSYDPDGGALNYEWSEGGNAFSTDSGPTVSFELGSHTITLKVTNPCGGSAQTNLTVLVVDTTAPVIVSTVTSVTVSADSNCQGAVPNVVASVVATDNCTSANGLTVAQNPAAGTLLGTGTHTITVTVSDASNNNSSTNVSFSVVDTTAPIIVSAPAPITVSADSNCQGAVPSIVGDVVATDNCTPPNQLTVTQNPAAGTLLATGAHAITVTVADASNNTSSTNVSFSVVDTTAPVIVSAPAPITVSADSNCQGAVPKIVADVVAADNCTPPNQLTVTQNPAAGTLLATGAHTITVMVADGSGNTTATNVAFSVVDTTAPVIVSAPAPITVSADSNCQGLVPNVVSGILATDNCTPPNQLTVTQNPAAGTLLGTGAHTITVTVTDGSGNTTVTNVSFSVVDTTAPVIVSAPAPISVSANSNGQGAVPNFVAGIVASDNCTPVNQLTVTQNPAAGILLAPGTYTITVTVVDASGNHSSTNVSFSVVDTTAPVIVSTPAPITVLADSNCQGAVPSIVPSVVATDNCTSANQLTVTQSPAAGTLLPTGAHTITVTVSDASGNNSSADVSFKVVDTTAPVIHSLTATPNVLSPPNHQLVPITISVTATDTCDPAPVSKIISITCNESSAPGDARITGNLTATLAATRNPTGSGRVYTITVGCTDASGNASTASVTVSVPKGNGR